MIMKAKIAVLEGFKKPLVIKHFDIPPLPQGSILVKMVASGICGSDLHMVDGEDPRVPLPIILGHEGVGEIVEINGEKKDLNGDTLKKGDLIIWDRGVVCGECYFCKVLKTPYLCENRKIYGINRSFKDYPYLTGAYAEYIILEKKTEILKLSSKTDPTVLVMAGCSGATAFHAIDSLEDNLLDKTVVVQGGGPLSIFALALSKFQGAKNTILITGSSFRKEITEKIGVDVVLDRTILKEEERINKILDMTYGKGADVVIEATGTNKAIPEGLRILRKGGTYIVVGVASPQEKVPVDFYDVSSKNITIKGVWVSDAEHFKKAVSFLEKNQDLFAPVVTHKISLDEINHRLDLVRERKAGKVVIEKF
ncbi:MAG: zinc-binding dehydrogenase [Dictyoglomus sp.]|uniref:zinc-binding dehydrogenase n=1 Tax=Dictyoglomus sp. TaxID=28205 RepID=UPI003D129958